MHYNGSIFKVSQKEKLRIIVQFKFFIPLFASGMKTFMGELWGLAQESGAYAQTMKELKGKENKVVGQYQYSGDCKSLMTQFDK